MIFHRENQNCQQATIAANDGAILKKHWTECRFPLNIRITRCDAMHEQLLGQRKPPHHETIPNNQRLLVGRKEAADLLSISARALDYLVSNRRLSTRRIGSRVLIPVSELQRFARADHPERLAG
jgi:excisionase family DNA binding protein